MQTAAKETTSRTAGAAASIGKTSLVLRDKLTAEQVDLLKKTVAKGASDDEFALFVHQCERTGLDPFARQIYCLQRRTKEGDKWINAMVTQVGIDGFRLIAERTGKYRGQTVPKFYDAKGNEREVWLDPAKPPVGCKVGVLHADFAEPLFVVVLYEEFVQKRQDGVPNAMWKSKPTVMLAKCAEAGALRKAFPQELSGLYTDDEIPADEIEVEPVQRQIPAARTHARAAIDTSGDVTAAVNNSGDVIVTFGSHKDVALKHIDTPYLIETFRDPWRDQERKDVATQRLGAGFVAAVYAELERRNVPDAMPLDIAQLIQRRLKGEVLPGPDAEKVSAFWKEHQGTEPSKAGEGGEA